MDTHTRSQSLSTLASRTASAHDQKLVHSLRDGKCASSDQRQHGAGECLLDTDWGEDFLCTLAELAFYRTSDLRAEVPLKFSLDRLQKLKDCSLRIIG